MGDLRTPVAPAAPQLNVALLVFLETMAVVARARARATNMDWLNEAVEGVWRGTQEMQNDIPQSFDDDWGDVASRAAARVLGLELMYIGYRHRDLLSEENRAVVEEFADYFPTVEIADPLSDDAVDVLEVGKGSIEKLINNMPRWLQRVMEVLMEALKILRP
ncbi:hypothetical protein SH591_00560 [Sphingomonas sp. LY54]|uniref:hypothetical protein n=1 Tax=Sphingomonas sp. LY54 TaxID=3095343 RepID=UPI002D79C9B6|nr:hypothetical protein [Sphingomonas sp. LY54]WRP28715.1 hypothetical protein SH591_00560 [Sphingomonas sp. LY54]